MHDTALQIGKLAFETYCTRKAPAILELGSFDVNGSFRAFAPDGSLYVGVDIVEGPGVDVVVTPGSPLPFPDDSFDFVIASSVFEHDAAFWNTFLELSRKTRRGGYVYINAPSNGAVHRYPEDIWRFYPDAGKALARWAVSQNIAVSLVESFTATRAGDIWNDFVAVFRKIPSRRPLPAKLVHHQVAGSFNIQVGNAFELLNPTTNTQDMNLIADARAHIAQASERIAGLEQAANDLRTSLDQRDHRLADLESTLRQREEEIEQTERARQIVRQEADGLGAALAKREHNCARLSEQLAQSEKSAFQLTAERTASLAAARHAEGELAANRRRMIMLAQHAASFDERLDRARQDLKSQRAEQRRLAFELTQRDGALASVQASIDEERAVRERVERELARRDKEAGALQAELADNVEKGRADRDRADQEEALRRSINLALEAANAQVTARFREIATLTRVLREREERAARERHGYAVMRHGFSTMDGAPWWRRIMPRDWQRQLLARALLSQGLFDARAYIARNPDVARERVDPVRHYILHGIIEDREV